MGRINLLGGTYQARSVIADAQRCLNLYPEKNPEDASAPYTNLLTPGQVLKATPGTAGVARCLYTATNGSLYYVCGQQVYYIDNTWTMHLLGTIAAGTKPVAMQDNGFVIILVDGTSSGYAINLQSGIVGQPLAGQVTNAGTAGGQPNAFAITAPGSGGTNGFYPNCPLTGGSGTNGAAAITVANPFAAAVSYSGLTLTMTTTVAHGLTTGSVFTVSGAGALTISAVDIPSLNGTWTALSGTSGTTLKWTLPAGPQGTGPNLGAVSAGGTGQITVANPLPVGTGYAVNDTVGVTGVTGLSGETLTVTSVGAISGTYSNIPLTGGSGTGATGEFELVNGTVISFSLDDTGLNYLVGDTLGTASIPGLTGFAFVLTGVGTALNAFAAITDPNFLGGVGIGYLDTFIVISQPNTRNWYSTLSNVTYSELTGVAGQPFQGTIIAPGAASSNGTFNNAALTGGSGTGATANITTAGGVVTSVVLLPTGLGYNAGDVLSATVAGLVGFQYSLVAVNPPAFDPTYVAAKVGYPDLLSTLAVVHREIWLFGAFESTEVWYDAGNAGFPFTIMPGVFIQHGCIAPYSVATHDLNVFWLSIDQAGQGTVFEGVGYSARRISTYAIEKIISNWVKAGATLSDAVGAIYKQEDHVFYVLSSASANATIVYDVTENLWHERAWTDNNGILNRIRANCMAFAYGVNVVGDWQNGNIYQLDLNTYTDFGGPITRRRGFPHLLNDGKRHSIDRFALDMDCGDGDASNITAQEPVTLEVSYDRGHTFFVTPTQSMGAQGDYLFQMQWRQVSGIGRDFVLRISWSGAAFTGISGAWLDDTLAET
jgi:hypothetical protein